MDNFEVELYHEGRAHDENPPGRGSGRWAWGTGENPYQREAFGVPMIKDLYKEGYDDKGIVKVFRDLGYDDLEIDEKLQKYGKKDGDIARALGIDSYKLRAKRSIRTNEIKIENTREAVELNKEGWSNQRIADKLGVTEGTVRNYLKDYHAQKDNKLFRVADGLQEMVDKKRYLDVGPGGEDGFGTTASNFKVAVALLEERGYHRYPLHLNRIGANTDNQLTMQILCPPDVTYKDMREHMDQIKSVKDYVIEDGLPKSNQLGLRYPVSVDSKRIEVKYGDQGGVDRDGVIQLKRGVEDLGLGSYMYAQVRIAVDGTHYLKGMAIYADPDQFPPGKDIIFNTNKESGTPWMQDDPKAKQVFKHLENDPDNPFKAAIKVKDGKVVGQWDYTGKDGKEHQSPINVVNFERDWGDWKKTSPPQMLVNQDRNTIKQQLKIAYENKVAQFNDIKSYTNPAIKKHLLKEFASECDTAAIELRGAPFIGQQQFAILPVPSLKPNEIYAPMYEEGSKVVSIRYPHQGLFEVVEYTVTHKNKEAKSFMLNATDAVGIHPNAAKQMSGADYDGDSVVIIPTVSADGKIINNIRKDKAIQELMDFDPNSFERKEGETFKRISKSYQNKMMGVATNLLQDMKTVGAPRKDIIDAVKFCYVIIDSEKHDLNWKAAEKQFHIKELKSRYQGNIDPTTGKETNGASTLITRAKSPVYRDKYNELWQPDKNTGEILYKSTPQMKNSKWHYDEELGRTVVDEKAPKQEKVPMMATVKDARELMSGPDHKGTPKEWDYAQFANDMKALANEVRREMVNTPTLEMNKEAKEKYADEVLSLKQKLKGIKENAPKERLATVIYNNIVKTKRNELMEKNPDMRKEERNKEMKKVKRLAAVYARQAVNAKKPTIEITDREWEAMQSGAVSQGTILDVLLNSDSEKIKQRAMPKNQEYISDADRLRIIAYLAKPEKSRPSIAEIAAIVGCSPSTVARYS